MTLRMKYSDVIERHPMDEDADHVDLWYRGSRVSCEPVRPLPVIDEYEAGDSYGYDTRTGWSAAEQRLVDEVARKEQGDPPELVAKVAYHYVVKGLPLAATGKVVGFSGPAVAALLRRHGLPVRRPGRPTRRAA